MEDVSAHVKVSSIRPLDCTDQIAQISASVWGDTDKIWHIRSLILICYHVRIPYPPADFIAQCVADSGRDVTDLWSQTDLACADWLLTGKSVN